MSRPGPDARGVDFFLLASEEPIARDYEGIASALRDPVVLSDMEAISVLSNRGSVHGAGCLLLVLRCGRRGSRYLCSRCAGQHGQRPIIEFRTARNRVGRTTSSLGAILDHASGGSASTAVSPPVTDPVSGDALSFLGLHASIDLPMAEVEYAYDYTTRGEDAASLRLAPRTDEARHLHGRSSTLLVIRGHPRETEPPIEEFARIASSLGSAVLGNGGKSRGRPGT